MSTPVPSALTIEGLGLQIGGATILHDVDIDIAPGSLVGVIGPNGAGKTTLFNVISGVATPTSGRIQMHGEDITRTSVSQRALNRRAMPLSVPTTCIYSKSDGIVAWQCCTSVPAPQTENIEVRSSHLGYGHNVQTLSVIADRLAQPEGGWQPYRR